MNILVVEDERNLADAICHILDEQGYKTEAAYDGNAGLAYARSGLYDAAILDIMLPGLSGLDILKSLRQGGSEMPIMMLTAKTSTQDKVEGLDRGADDYLTKPFSVEELLARLRVTFRRLAREEGSGGSSSGAPASRFENGELVIDYAAGTVSLAGRELHLTPIEYRLLCLLARNVGKVLTHRFILREVWGSGAVKDRELASLRVFMGSLRKKIEADPAHPVYIQTHVGVGYRMLRV